MPFAQRCYDDPDRDVETHSASETLGMLVVTWVVHSSVFARVEEGAFESLRRDEEAFVHCQATPNDYEPAPAAAMLASNQE